jgi:hypothetical protein
MLAKPLKEVMMALHIPTDQDGSVLKDGSWVPVPNKEASKPHHETANENEKENDYENQSAAQEATHHHHHPHNRMRGPPNLRTSTSQDSSGSTASSVISYLAATQQPPKTWVVTPDKISLPKIKARATTTTHHRHHHPRLSNNACANLNASCRKQISNGKPNDKPTPIYCGVKRNAVIRFSKPCSYDCISVKPNSRPTKMPWKSTSKPSANMCTRRHRHLEEGALNKTRLHLP